MSNIQRNAEFYLESIHEYIEDDKNYDYALFAKNQKKPAISRLEKMLEFARITLTKEDYQKLLNKIYPFEPNLDGSDVEEKEAFKKAVCDIALKVAYDNKNLIEIIDAFDGKHISVKQYMYLLKQLTYNYKELNISAFYSNNAYTSTIEGYDNPNAVCNAEFPNLTESQKREMEEVITSRGLYVNNVTLNAAYDYCRRNKKNITR